jgi:hypothetical protein
MKEKDILKLAEVELRKEGKIPWIAYKRTFFAQQDIFGIFDIVYFQHGNTGTHTGFIQCTTHHHISDRRKKLVAFFRREKFAIPPRCFVWGYDSERKRFTKKTVK